MVHSKKMPFTPFHLGPGAAVKAIAGDDFSFIVFGGAQALMDIEPLVHMVRGDAVLHGLSLPSSVPPRLAQFPL
jgi:hypothetical protein